MVFATLDHQAAAKSKGLAMPFSTVLVFGNPKIGTPGFIRKPELAIDLPLKALIYQAEDGKTYIAYSDPAYLSKRYGVSEPAKVFNKMSGVLKNVTAAAGKK